MNPTEHLSRQERIRRIAELLSKGITLMLMREREAAAANTATPCTSEGEIGASSEALSLDDTSKDIIAYLARVGPAAIREIHAALDIPTRSACRKLGQLRKCGLVQRRGATTAVRYALAAQMRNGFGQSGLSHAAFRKPGDQCDGAEDTTA
jgi:hypothetical protein